MDSPLLLSTEQIKLIESGLENLISWLSVHLLTTPSQGCDPTLPVSGRWCPWRSWVNTTSRLVRLV